MVMRRRALLLVLTVTAVLAQALPAKACSCAYPDDPRESLIESDGAIVGTLLSRRPAADTNFQTDVFTFRVDFVAKGEFGETVEVYSANNGAACGLEVAEGSETGLFMWIDEPKGTWWSGLCSQIDPERLREAAAPLPEPNGRGPVRLLAGGSWGEVGHLALDGRGRTLGYGLGDHDDVRLAVCPGATRFLEVYLEGRRRMMTVRRLRTNRVVETVPVRLGRDSTRWESPIAVRCMARTGGSVLLATSDGDEGRILRVGLEGSKVLYQGKLRDVAFAGGGVAYVQRGRGGEIVEVRLATGAARHLVTPPPDSIALTLSPDARHLAVYARGDVVVFDLARDARRARRTVGRDRYGDLVWWGDDRLVFFPVSRQDDVTVVDAELTRARRIGGRWGGYSNAIAGDTAYGLGSGRLFRLRLLGGSPEKIRTFPSGQLVWLEAVPGDAETEWPRD